MRHRAARSGIDWGSAVVQFGWAIGEAIVLAILLREWFSIQRELKRDAALREAESSAASSEDDNDEEDKTPVPGITSGPLVTHAEGQQGLHPGLHKAVD